MTHHNLLKSSTVMAFFGYTRRQSFWEFVKTKGVPHIRLNSRRIMFNPVALNHWIEKRDSAGRNGQFVFSGEHPNQS